MGKLEFILGRIDLVAIVVTLLGICLLALAGIVTAMIGVAKLISGLWSNPIYRWLIIILGVAMVWVAVRWKKSRDV